MPKFFVGIHHPNKAWRLDHAFISANAIRDRHPPILANEWVMDSGAFTEITAHGAYRYGVEDYAELIRRFATSGQLLAAVAQDYMCEPFVLEITGSTIREHQRMTIVRYDQLMRCDVGGVYIMPVLQGFLPHHYARHVRDYGSRLKPGAWVGVGSVCKRQGSPDGIRAVLEAILEVRPDLKLHGFGVKLTALRNPRICRLLHTADSMAWSFAARKQGRDPNDAWEARYFELMVLKAMNQLPEEGSWASAFMWMLIRHRFRKIQTEAATLLLRDELLAVA